MIAVHVEGVRVGSVLKIEGEPAATRWYAYASNERKKGFPLRRLAVEWLVKLHNGELED